MTGPLYLAWRYVAYHRALDVSLDTTLRPTE